MKTLKVAIILILYFLFLQGINQAQACGSDGQCYDEYMQIDNSWQTYTNYFYNAKIYKILIPNSRQEFIKLEFKYMTWQMTINHKHYNTIRLNILLIKMWLEPLYY